MMQLFESALLLKASASTAIAEIHILSENSALFSFKPFIFGLSRLNLTGFIVYHDLIGLIMRCEY
jgi:hypothetical protein